MLTARRKPFRRPFHFGKFVNDIIILMTYRAYRAGFGSGREKEKEEGLYNYIYYIQLYYYTCTWPLSVFAFLCELRAVSAVSHQNIENIGKSVFADSRRKYAVCAVSGSSICSGGR